MTALKKKIFAVQRAPRWGYVGTPCGARRTAPSSVGKIYEKKGFLIEQVKVQVKNVYVKHPYQHSAYHTLYPP